MKKREAKFQSVFNNYLREKKLYGNFELKQTTEDNIPFDSVKPHQSEALLAAWKHGFVWKFSDEDSRIKPFDCSNVPPVQGYVVIKYPKVFYIIKINEFLKEKFHSSRKSLTNIAAQRIADHEVYC